MLAPQEQQEFYNAFIGKNPEYEGLFFAGIKTTGIFCRPTCSARKPKFENCDFFKHSQDALLAGYRPCKRCQPLSLPNQESALIRTLIEAVENQPEKRWKDKDFRALGVDTSTVRRQFKKRFGMTFVAYARARRMGIALKEIREGQSVIDSQLLTGYESGSGFRDAFSRILGKAPSASDCDTLKAAWIDTRLGPMVSIADDNALYLLEFVDRRGLEREIERMRKRMKIAIIPGKTKITDLIEKELNDYFSGNLQTFNTPIAFKGSDFQCDVWKTLLQIPYGETKSYSDLAKFLGRPQAVRAVANANGRNQLAIIVPCHRIIGKNNELVGYSGGLARKKWLIEHENSQNK